MSAWTLRLAQAGDDDFLFRVYASTRQEELAVTGWDEARIDAFLRAQFEAQNHHYELHYPQAERSVIQVDGADAGRLYVERAARLIEILDIALLPAYRGQGVGAVILRSLQREAAAGYKRLGIFVEVNNPAQRLYRRLGFTEIGAHGVYLEMRWHASAVEVPNSMQTELIHDLQA
jgi:ribosomal protein S18 acetylase RimI-like enzyme